MQALKRAQQIHKQNSDICNEIHTKELEKYIKKIDLLQYIEENTEKPKSKKTVLQTQALLKAQQIHKKCRYL